MSFTGYTPSFPFFLERLLTGLACLVLLSSTTIERTARKKEEEWLEEREEERAVDEGKMRDSVQCSKFLY